MAGVAVVEAFGFDFEQALLEAVEERDARRRRGHALDMVVVELDQVEVVAAVRRLLGAFPGALADGEDRQAGGQGEGLLGTREEDVDAELVLLDLDGREGADGIGDRDHVGELADHGHDVGDGREGAGGGLGVDEGDAVELAGGEGLADGFRVDGLAPVELQGFGVLAAALGDIVPLVGERAVHAVEHALAADVAEGAFHHAPGGARGEIDRVLGVEHGLQSRLHVIVQLDEIAGTMADHGFSHGLGDRIGDGQGSGYI